jgi:hypothetical protein
MNTKRKPSALRGIMATHYGTIREMAEDLGVTSCTLANYLNKAPEGFLKHAQALQNRGVSPDELLQAIRHHKMHN